MFEGLTVMRNRKFPDWFPTPCPLENPKRSSVFFIIWFDRDNCLENLSKGQPIRDNLCHNIICSLLSDDSYHSQEVKHEVDVLNVGRPHNLGKETN